MFALVLSELCTFESARGLVEPIVNHRFVVEAKSQVRSAPSGVNIETVFLEVIENKAIG